MPPKALPQQPTALTRRDLLRALLALAATCAAGVLIDRLLLPDAISGEKGALLCRCRVVAPPPGSPAAADAVFVRPRAGPKKGRVVSAVYAAAAASRPAELLGAGVFVEFPAGGGRPVVRSPARDRLLLALAGVLFALIVLIAGRALWRLVPALLVGGGVLLGVLVPCLLRGVSPLAAGLLTGAVFLLAGAALIGKASRRSLGILAGGLGGLAAAAVLAVLALRVGRMTGVYSALTKDLWYDPAVTLDFRQLLAAGMIVGACGIILDLAAAVTSAVHEVARANPTLTRRQLAAAGLAVGRDVMGTELNTLIFAYAGAHFGVLLLPTLGAALRGYEIPPLRIFSMQDVAAEIFQMLVGTVALILTIPITAAAAAVLLGGGPRPVSAPRPTRRRFRPSRRWLLCAAGVVLAWGAATLWQRSLHHRYGPRPADAPNTARYLVQGRVRDAHPPAARLAMTQQREQIQEVTCVLTSGPRRGQTVPDVPNAVSGFPGHDKILAPGDSVLLQTWVRDGQITYATIIDYSRGAWLIHFAFVLVAVVLVVGKARGLRALVALLVSAAVLYPAMIAVAAAGAGGPPAAPGEPPAQPASVALPIFLAAALGLCLMVFLILAGPTRKALAGAAGSFGGLLAGGGCALAAAGALHLSGRQSDAMAAIRMFTRAANLDYKGLLQAGMVLGIVGAGMDVAIAIVSAVGQVRLAKPAATAAELFRSGLAVGRGIMIPMVLVLAFAYIGLSLPILILPRVLPGQHLSLLISNERISVEVLRILVGGIGVVCTVPITAAVAAAVHKARRVPN